MTDATEPSAPAVGLSVEVEAWTDVHHARPLAERRTRVRITPPGGLTIALTGAGVTLLIEADSDGICTITRVTAAPGDEGVEVYAGSLGAS